MSSFDFYFARSGNSLRAAIALELAEVPVRRHLLDLSTAEHNNDWFKKITPAGHVPVLHIHQKDGRDLVLTQSGAIMDHVLGERRPELWPENTLDRANCTAMVHNAISDIAVQNTLARYLAHEPNAANLVLERMWTSLYAAFGPLQNAPYLCGDTPTIADFAHFPVVYMRAPHLRSIPRAAHVIKWLDRMAQTDPVATAIEYAGVQIKG
ncbi:glutathione S-transferase family protein [Parasedimentitalea maritima]|uniref:Glutathione S-transferase family protein n=1 Tax=Parasedimentitalea maritima TaxID=2578117 RepID=A0ABY2UNE9_9RHOB|nr:glutathione S-transferase family protein [Zongyanglinia marina]TLP55339.1 glutathione S-transferase family protein [Zongyanglinia marina]